MNLKLEEKRKFSLQNISQLLLDRNVITQEQYRLIMIKENVQRTRILRDKAGTYPVGGKVRYEVSPVEIIASLKLSIPTVPPRTLTEDDIIKVVAENAKFPYQKLDPLKLNMKLITDTLSRPFARRHVVLPVSLNNRELTVAIENPFDTELLENLKRITNYSIKPVVTSKADILKVITEVYGFRSSVMAASREIAAAPELSNLEQLFKLKRVEEIEATDEHIVNAVEYLIHYALGQRASDIHIEPKREHSQIRLRIDGVLHDIYTIPKVVHPAFLSRIKIMSRMDISEKRKPQDGRIKTAHQSKEIELRVSTLPTAFGEKVVIRIFDPEVLLQDISALGFFPEELRLYESFISKPYGMLLVTGPTGSGKTTTLYSTLRALATPEVNIISIEDPIEMVYEQFNQIAVHPKIDITFASALRTILRQDPDIIMVGEIRDSETAENAVQAALTGHLVLSTLHTNDTAGAVTRLQELGIKPFLISSTLIGVLAQRLVRKICEQCRASTFLTPDQIAMLGIKLPEGSERKLPVSYGQGCVKCRGTGYYGRTGIFEVMEISDKIRKLINEGADAKETRKVAKLDGMMTLRECAIKKLATGITSFDEVVQATAEKL